MMVIPTGTLFMNEVVRKLSCLTNQRTIKDLMACGDTLLIHPVGQPVFDM